MHHAMHLKHLVLNGYKTFANKTAFDFNEGVTAVIGPNGSGKSNVADSIRWALGEQQFSLLRGKKTDDMIFAGSTRRPRASMAEVLLIFDNSDGFFPVEFTEIAIGRRAYRDGMNEYLLNGNRVRLRDITDLLGHTGLAERTYTVIGQGLVDTALTQRPEERRALFEEAAGIGVYRDRRDDALRKLEETKHNLERVRDILTEITPRVHQLERQATRARQYQVFSAQLIELTRAWFSFHYRSARVAVNVSGAARDQLQERVNQARTVVEALERQANQLQTQQTDLRAHVSEELPRRDEARRHNEAVSRDLAVLRERAASVKSQLSAARRELAERRQALEGLSVRATHASAVLIGAQATLTQRQAELEVAEAAAAERQAARAALEKARADAQSELTRDASALSGVQNRLNALRARQAVLTKQRSDLAERANRATDQRERESKTLAELNANIEKDAAQLREMNTEHELLAREMEAARALTSAAQSALAAAEAEEKMANRMHQFAELRQQGGGELADQARAAHLPGLRGTLASLVHVLPDDQRAVEAALGDLMKAVVIESPEGVTRTRAWLVTQKARNTRLSVIPLPFMRSPVPERALLDAALVERARALHARPLMESISAPDWLKAALQVLVGRAFITRDMDAARTLVAQLPEGAQCVTRDGEVVYASGLLTLPPGPRTPVILGEEPKQEQAPLIDPVAAKANREHAAQARDSAQRAQDLARRKLDEQSRARDAFSREASARRSRRDDAARRITSLEEQLAQMSGDVAQAERDLAHTSEQASAIAETLAQHEAAHAQATQRLAEIEAELRQHMAGGWMESLNAVHAAVASATEGLRSAQNMRRERLSALAEGRSQRDSRARLLADLETQHSAAQTKLQTAEQAASDAAARLQELDELLRPVQSELAMVEKHLAEVESQRREAERTLRELESQLNSTLLDLARHNDELEALYERATDALELEDRQADAANGNGNHHEPSPMPPQADSTQAPTTPAPQAVAEASQAAATDQPEAPSAEPAISNPQSPISDPETAAIERRASIIALLEALPEVSSLPEGIDERITHVRNQIKRLGAINFEAQVEYEELSQRHAFLTEQVGDLERASASLQQVIVELNDVMQATFKQTFEAIATAFQSTFKVLFGGGQARLTLMNAENIDEAGIEIHAQPPGKRPQGLALLSGGERSLTAAALLFAILRVKPTPFCVLDEVDAALDEANVGRFRNMLESLGEQTQFIVITHNRRTVEAADAVYGISMGADGASTALSLKLDEAAAATTEANGA
jgi:chromosome segregation protein